MSWLLQCRDADASLSFELVPSDSKLKRIERCSSCLCSLGADFLLEA